MQNTSEGGLAETGTGTGTVAVAEVGGRQRVDRRLSEALTGEQREALELITQGTAIQEIGKKLKIHRGTIYRWLKADPYFRAAYNAWQLEQRESLRAAMMKAGEAAVARVIQSIPIDPNLSWRVIKELGILSRPSQLPVNPGRVEMQIALEDHEEETLLLKRIDQELDSDTLSPRGELRRLMGRREAAEWGPAIPPRTPPTAPGTDAGTTPATEVSRA